MEEIEYLPLLGAPSENKNAPKIERVRVEMAGIEPASERLDPRKSTSVAGWACRHRSLSRQT